MLKLFLDSEFTGLHQQTSLISIALVAETGEEFYGEFTDYDKTQITDWISTNVLSNLFLERNTNTKNDKKYFICGNKQTIKNALEDWLQQFDTKTNEKKEIVPTIQIWADVPHYDWILFCELFGGAFGIPKQIHYMPMDIATLLYAKGVDINAPRMGLVDEATLPDGLKLHNALYDAHLGKLVTEKYLYL